MQLSKSQSNLHIADLDKPVTKLQPAAFQSTMIYSLVPNSSLSPVLPPPPFCSVSVLFWLFPSEFVHPLSGHSPSVSVIVSLCLPLSLVLRIPIAAPFLSAFLHRSLRSPLQREAENLFFSPSSCRAAIIGY